jgi:exosortase
MRSRCFCSPFFAMSAETYTDPKAERAASNWTAWYAATGILLMVIFAPTFRWLFYSWMNDRFYSHGLLVALVCAWLISQQGTALKRCVVSSSSSGIPLIAIGLILEMCGAISDVMTFSGIALVLVAAGLILACRGRETFRLVSFPVLYFLFAVPVISAASDASGRVLTPMMELATSITAAITDLIGLHPLKSGTILRLPGYTMEVVVPCSGMASVVGLMALAALLAHLSGTRPARGFILVLSAVPVALAANVIRLTLTALLGVTCGARIASGFLHEASGIFTFLLGAAIIAAIPRGKRSEE